LSIVYCLLSSVYCLWSMVYGLWSVVYGLRSAVCGLGFRVSGFGFRVSGLGFMHGTSVPNLGYGIFGVYPLSEHPLMAEHRPNLEAFAARGIRFLVR